MQATYKLQRSSGGIVGAAMVFLAVLILGGAGGYVLKSVSVTTTTVRSIPASSSPR